jgi:hypothetical protein
MFLYDIKLATEAMAFIAGLGTWIVTALGAALFFLQRQQCRRY